MSEDTFKVTYTESALSEKYPNQYWIWSNTNHVNWIGDFEGWLNFWAKDWECESWEALELESRKSCVVCKTESGVTVGQTRGVDGVLIEGVSWCGKCGNEWTKYSERI